MELHFEELAAIVTREHGKTLAEARAEVMRGMEMVEFACGIPSLLMGQTLPNIASSVDAETVRHRSAFVSGSHLTTFRTWCPFGCFRSRSFAAIPSC